MRNHPGTASLAYLHQNTAAKGRGLPKICRQPSFRLVPVLSLIFGFIFLLPFSVARAVTAPDLMLADVYRQGLDISQYRISEKLDGVRARWDGTKLISRGGNIFAAPDWFIKEFPAIPLDGELWMGRGRYEEVSSNVRRQHPHDGWRNIRLMVFDLPTHGGTFEERMMAMKHLHADNNSPFLDFVEQREIGSAEELRTWLKTVTAQGGEGLMLHRKTAVYAAGRSHDLLKLFADAEAMVIGYKPGKGQFAGQVGSLMVRTDQGVIFSIGSGLTHEQRRRPPPLQSRITFRHQGLTKKGIPRFPVFLRIRDEEPPQ